MNLYLLSPTEKGKKRIGWDCFLGFVVRANTEEEARSFCRGMDEGENFWRDPDLSECEVLDSDGEPGIILESFSAG